MVVVQQPQRGRAKRRGRNRAIRPSDTLVTAPSGVGISGNPIRNPSNGGTCYSPTLGSGDRISGCCPVAYLDPISGSPGTSNFTSYGTWGFQNTPFDSLNAQNAVYVNPLTLDATNRLGTMSQFYSNYVFKYLKMWYLPFASTSTSGEITLSWSRNPDFGQIGTSSVGLRSLSIDGTIQTSPWVQKSSVLLDARRIKTDNYFRMIPGWDSSYASPAWSQAEINEACQGVLINFASTNFSGIIGVVFMEYEVELYARQALPNPQYTFGNFTEPELKDAKERPKLKIVAPTVSSPMNSRSIPSASLPILSKTESDSFVPVGHES
jgi:hypothetical protein